MICQPRIEFARMLHILLFCFLSAVLENHHIALSFKLTQQSKDVNIFQNLDL